MIIQSTKDKFNAKDKYDGNLLELRDLTTKKLEYRETKDDLQLKKTDFMNMIPAVFNLKDIGDHLDKYKDSMSETPNWVTYMFLYPDYEVTWTFAGKTFYHAPLYVGKGTIDRVISHEKLSKNASKAEIRLNSYIVGWRAQGIEPKVVILFKDFDETRAKWGEADSIKVINLLQHYITGDPILRLAPKFLNVRDELSNEGYIIKANNTFGRTRP